MRRRGLEPPPGYPGPGPQPGCGLRAGHKRACRAKFVGRKGRFGRVGRAGCCHGCCHGAPRWAAAGVRRPNYPRPVGGRTMPSASPTGVALADTARRAGPTDSTARYVGRRRRAVRRRARRPTDRGADYPPAATSYGASAPHARPDACGDPGSSALDTSGRPADSPAREPRTCACAWVRAMAGGDAWGAGSLEPPEAIGAGRPGTKSQRALGTPSRTQGVDRRSPRHRPSYATPPRSSRPHWLEEAHKRRRRLRNSSSVESPWRSLAGGPPLTS
jgi:hypothetical protein